MATISTSIEHSTESCPEQLDKKKEANSNGKGRVKLSLFLVGMIQMASIHWIIEKPTEFQKNIYFYFIDYAKAFDCVDHNKLWRIIKEMGIPDHLTCLLRNLSQEAAVRTEHGKMDSFKIGKGVYKGVYCYSAYLISMQSTL